MNDNDYINNTQPSNNTYRATRNLNTEIENPEININSAVGINIQDSFDNTNISNPDSINNYLNFNNNNGFTQPEVDNNYQNNSYYPNDYNNNYNMQNNHQETNNSTFINNTKIKEEQEPNHTISFNNKTEEPKSQYKPLLKQKKKKESIAIPSELKVTMFIVFLLLLFIVVMPYIFDFVKQIELSLTR